MASSPWAVSCTVYPRRRRISQVRRRTPSSSSTTRMVSLPPGDRAAAAQSGERAHESTRGRKMVTVVPRPGALSTTISPLLCVTMPYVMASPRPVPLPGSFVVKKGSNRCSMTSGPIPIPVSRTVSTTYGPGASRRGTARARTPPRG